MGRGGEPGARVPMAAGPPWRDDAFEDWYRLVRAVVEAYEIPAQAFPHALVDQVRTLDAPPRYLLLISSGVGIWHPERAIAPETLESALRVLLATLRRPEWALAYDLRPPGTGGVPVLIDWTITFDGTPGPRRPARSAMRRARAQQVLAGRPAANLAAAGSDLERFLLTFRTADPAAPLRTFYVPDLEEYAPDIGMHAAAYLALEAVYDLDTGTDPVALTLGARAVTPQGLVEIRE